MFKVSVLFAEVFSDTTAVAEHGRPRLVDELQAVLKAEAEGGISEELKVPWRCLASPVLQWYRGA